MDPGQHGDNERAGARRDRTAAHAVVVSVMVAGIAIAHYGTDPHAMLYHDVLRRATYLPIVLAAVWFGTVGGVSVSLIAVLLYAPHMLLQLHLSPDARIDQMAEMLLYVLVGGFSGLLVEREQVQRRQTEKALLNLQRAHGDLRRHATQLSEMQEALRQVERLSTLGELAADLAHEIRNPLAAVRGTLQILSGNPPPDEKQRFTKLVIAEVDRLDRVVEGYLRAARAGTARGGRADIGAALTSVIDLIRSQAERNHVTIECSGGSGLVAPLDLHRLTQVFVNLVLNAVQAMPTGGALRILCRAIPGSDGIPAWTEIIFSDSGAGIAPEDREQIFRPFFTTKSSGTGLGLSIAHRLVTEHGGTLTLDAPTGSGTVFRLRLPFIAQP